MIEPKITFNGKLIVIEMPHDIMLCESARKRFENRIANAVAPLVGEHAPCGWCGSTLGCDDVVYDYPRCVSCGGC